MKHELYDIWKDGFNPKTPWSVQLPKGIIGFRTKKLATAFVDQARKVMLDAR